MTLIEKSGIIASIILIAAVMFLIVFAKHGILDYRTLKLKHKSIADQTKTVEDKNSQLESEVLKLKTDIEYIKHVAKHEYEMIEKDEIVFKDIDPQKKETE